MTCNAPRSFHPDLVKVGRCDTYLWVVLGDAARRMLSGGNDVRIEARFMAPDLLILQLNNMRGVRLQDYGAASRADFRESSEAVTNLHLVPYGPLRPATVVASQPGRLALRLPS